MSQGADFEANRPRLVREAVESVLAQTYRPIEVIVVDHMEKTAIAN